MTPTAPELVRMLAGYRYDLTSEDDLQQGLAEAMLRERVEFQKEVRLSPRDRIDFMVGRVGVEVKVGGSLSALIRQLYRYAEHQEVDSLVLVSSRIRLDRLPDTILGKPVHTCPLLGSLL